MSEIGSAEEIMESCVLFIFKRCFGILKINFGGLCNEFIFGISARTYYMFNKRRVTESYYIIAVPTEKSFEYYIEKGFLILRPQLKVVWRKIPPAVVNPIFLVDYAMVIRNSVESALEILNRESRLNVGPPTVRIIDRSLLFLLYFGRNFLLEELDAAFIVAGFKSLYSQVVILTGRGGDGAGDCEKKSDGGFADNGRHK